jgi:hypothetical protein
MVRGEDALSELLRLLKAAHYRFIAVTPATHAIVFARQPPPQLSLRDIFGWNRPFDRGDISPSLLDLLGAAGALESWQDKLRSKVRVATLGNDLLLHSAFPTDHVNSVFFGPDTYRFVRFLEQQVPRIERAEWLVDMGAGSGAGAIAASRLRGFTGITMVDVNGEALRLARVNAAAAGVQAETTTDDTIPTGADVVIANPPYMIDSTGRSYRDGGGLLGGALALEWVTQALRSVARGGTMLLYAGAAFANGEAPVLREIGKVCSKAAASLELSEIDPDVFGDELSMAGYEQVERIAAIGAVIKTRGE